MTPDELVETWRQTAHDQFERADFAEVQGQRCKLDIPFLVHFVASVDGVFGPWSQRIAALLREFGFDVADHEEATTDTLRAVTQEMPDIVLVLCTSTDLQILCMAMATEPSVSDRLLVCVPEDDDGMLYCRLLRERYSVETLSLPLQRLQNGDRCRFGVDVLRRCSDQMCDKVATARRDARIKKTYVLLVHGIRTRAMWQGPIKKALQDAGLIAWPTNYGKFDVVRLLLPFDRPKHRAIDRVKNEISKLERNAPDAELGVVAHSFGSYIVGRLLLSGYTFKTVALCGSVLRTDFDFSKASGAVIVNEVGPSDIWPVLAARLAWWAYGPTGTFGFNSGSVTDRVHADFRHSSTLRTQFCSKFWVPLFCDQRVVEGTNEDGAQSSRFVRCVDKVPFGPVVWALVALGLCTGCYLALSWAARWFL